MQAAWSRAIATDKNSDVIIPVIGSHSSSSSSNHNVSYESGYEYVIDAEFFLGDLCELYGVKQQHQQQQTRISPSGKKLKNNSTVNTRFEPNWAAVHEIILSCQKSPATSAAAAAAAAATFKGTRFKLRNLVDLRRSLAGLSRNSDTNETQLKENEEGPRFENLNLGKKKKKMYGFGSFRSFSYGSTTSSSSSNRQGTVLRFFKEDKGKDHEEDSLSRHNSMKRKDQNELKRKISNQRKYFKRSIIIQLLKAFEAVSSILRDGGEQFQIEFVQQGGLHSVVDILRCANADFILQDNNSNDTDKLEIIILFSRLPMDYLQEWGSIPAVPEAYKIAAREFDSRLTPPGEPEYTDNLCSYVVCESCVRKNQKLILLMHLSHW